MDKIFPLSQSRTTEFEQNLRFFTRFSSSFFCFVLASFDICGRTEILSSSTLFGLFHDIQISVHIYLFLDIFWKYFDFASNFSSNLARNSFSVFSNCLISFCTCDRRCFFTSSRLTRTVDILTSWVLLCFFASTIIEMKITKLK